MATLDRLLADLASPDPAVRDTGAYARLARSIAAGDWSDEDLDRIAVTMVQRLDHPRVEARTFAPLILACLVEAGRFEPGWLEAVTRWFLREDDLRGFDEDLGWLHAVAHGADFYGACGAAGAADPERLLAALAARLVEPTGQVWRDQEDDRMACALAYVLSHPGLDERAAVAWLNPVAELFASGTPGPVPAQASNTMRTLRSLAVALREEVHQGDRVLTIPHHAAVLAEVARLLALVTTWFWFPRRRHPAGLCGIPLLPRTTRGPGPPKRTGPSADADESAATSHQVT